MSQSSHPSANDSVGNIDEVESEPKNVCEILEKEGVHESPIDINISKAIPVNIAPPLYWINYELPPKKMKITNTGHTVILSAKWGQERPYITNGVLSGKYVFSQMHLHWGVNDMEGSEHTIDGCPYPGELHVVMFKACYLTQESALKERDGIVILVYILKLQEPPNPDFQPIIDALPAIAKAHSSEKISPVPLSVMIRQFESDYFVYRGAISTSNCVHQILWMITRIPIGVSSDQMDSLRFLLDNDDDIIRRNFRPIQPVESRHVFHILPSSSKYSTLLPVPMLNIEDKGLTQIYTIQLVYNGHMDYLQQTARNYKQKKKSKAKNCFDEDMRMSDEQLARKTLSVISELSKYMDYIYYMAFSLFLITDSLERNRDAIKGQNPLS